MDEQLKKYESLLLEKEALEKECFEMSLEYARIFGDEVEALYHLRVDVITLKKKLAYCVKRRYLNQTIYSYELDRYIDSEILEYRRKLEDWMALNQASKEKGEKVGFDEMKKIKKLYYDIVHLLHPDLHPEYQDNEDLQALWDKSVSAYKRNDYAALSEAYDQILLSISSEDVSIDHLEEKMAALEEKIQTIRENEPYTYRFLLDDEEEIEALHQSIGREIDDYRAYLDSLEGELAKFDIEVGGQA